MKLFYWTTLLYNLLFLSCTSLKGSKAVSSAQNVMAWEVFENSLSASSDKAILEQLQGLWTADSVLNKNGEKVSIINIENFTFEVKDSTYRSSEELRLKPFLLKQNIIYNPITGDSTIIEKLTDNELIITLKEDNYNSIRYYFKKVIAK